MANRDRDTQKSNHTEITSQVHGLPSGAHVLGNRSAAGEFVQRGKTGDLTTGTSPYSLYFVNTAVTFAVAFSAAPHVVAGAGNNVNNVTLGSAQNVSTTGFTFNLLSLGLGSISSNLNSWIAIGS